MKIVKYAAITILTIILYLIYLNKGGTDYHAVAFWCLWTPLILVNVSLFIFFPYRYEMINYLIILMSIFVIALGLYTLRNCYINNNLFFYTY
jgi:hypothetical protein